MGDRCYIEIEYNKRDEKLVEEIIGEGEEVFCENNRIRVSFTEYNYGAYDERNKLADAGISFIGYHGEGGDYGAMKFAAFGSKMIEVAFDCHGGNIFVGMKHKGDQLVPCETDLADAQAFFDLEKKAIDSIASPVKKHHETYGKNYRHGCMYFTTHDDRELALKIVHYMLMEHNAPTDQLVDELTIQLGVRRERIFVLAENLYKWLMEDEISLGYIPKRRVNVEDMDRIEGKWRRREDERKGLVT